MLHRSKHMPFYIILCGFLGMSIGFNFIQHEEIKLLRKEKIMYRVFFEYLYLKLENLENKESEE